MALDYLPSWGQLPVEQYLIESWSYTSTKQPSAQRTRLVKQFLNLDFNLDWDPTNRATNPDAQPVRVPTEEKISIILRPWQSDNIRRRAWRVWEFYNNGGGNNLLLLRTWYNPADNERVESRATMLEDFADDVDWAFLDDHAVFNFGVGLWQQVLEILPEIAIPFAQDTPPENIRRKDWRADMDAIPPMEVFEEGDLGADYVVAAGNAGDREVYYWTREDLEDDPRPGDEDED